MGRGEQLSQYLGEIDKAAQNASRANSKIGEIFSTGVTVTSATTGKKTVATPQTIRNLYAEFVDKPLHELTRPAAIADLQKMYSLSRGVTPAEIKALGSDPTSPLAQSATAKMESIRQDFTNIVTSKDPARIAVMYRGIAKHLREQDFSYLGKMQDLKGIAEHAPDCFMYDGAQSYFEQMFDYGNESSTLKECKEAVTHIDAALKSDGTTFDDIGAKMKAVQIMSQQTRQMLTKECTGLDSEAVMTSIVPNTGIVSAVSRKFDGIKKLDEIKDSTALMQSSLGSLGIMLTAAQSMEPYKDQLIDEALGDKRAVPLLRFKDSPDLMDEFEKESQRISDVQSMSKKEFSESIKAKAKAGKPYDKAEMLRYMTNQDGLISSDDKKRMAEAESGDFSHFEKMSVVSRNMLASKYMLQNPDALMKAPDETVKKLETKEKELGTNEIQNPLLRLGISLEMRSEDPEVAQRCKMLDSKLNESVMKKTLKAPDAAAVQRLQQAQPQGFQEALDRNAKSQAIMGKTMLMAQMGQMTMKVGDEDKFWKGSVANAFSHCSRVKVAFPAGATAQDPILHSFLGEKPGEDTSIVKKRGAATHSVVLSTVSEGLEMEETKGTCLSNQFGMNVAIGGIGNAGIGGPGGAQRPLLNNGSCGHMYMHIQKGDDAHYGGMLIGFESDAAGVTNQMGHTHDIFATPEKASSFGGQRTDEIGSKYGGRSIDLRSLTKEDLVTVFSAYDAKLTSASKDSTDLSSFYGKLCGQAMNPEQLSDFLEHDLSISHDKVAGILSRCTMSELSEKNMKDLAVLYDNSKNYMDAKGIKVEPRKIPDDKIKKFEDAIAKMPQGKERTAAEQMYRVYRGQNEIGNQQKEIGARMRAVKDTSSLVKDPTTPIRVKKYAMQQERVCATAQKEAYATSDKAEGYLRQLCGMEPKKITDDQAIKFAQDKAALPVHDVRSKALGGAKVVTTKDDYDQMTAKMTTTKRSFLGIKLSSSDTYQSVQHEMDKIKALHEVPVDKDSLHNLATSYETLGAACKQYIVDHKNPRTDDGKARLAMVKDVLDKQQGVDFEKYQDPAEFAKIEGKQWKAVDYKKAPAAKKMDLDGIKAEDKKEKAAASKDTAPKKLSKTQRLRQAFARKKEQPTGEKKEESVDKSSKGRGSVPTAPGHKK